MGRLIWAAIISILIIVGMIISSVNHLNLDDPEDRKQLAVEYSQWLIHVGSNVKSTIGYVVKQDWDIEPELNETEEDQE